MLTLQNARAKALVDPLEGGRLASLTIDGVEIIGSAPSEPSLPSSWFHGCFPMAPYVGRIPGGRFVYDGVVHHLTINAGSDAGHGVVFNNEWSISAFNARRLLLGTPLPPAWPMGGRADLSYVLQETSLELRLTLSATNESFPASIGFHPWFRDAIFPNGPAVVEFNPTVRYMPSKQDGLWRPQNELGMSPYDDVFGGLRGEPTVRWEGGPSIALHSDSPLWIYCEKEGAFCLEPITGPPNSLNLPNPRIVTKDRPLALTLTITWGPPQELRE